MTIQYRQAEVDDINFIIPTWLQGARKTERHTYIHNADYFKYYRNHILNLLSKNFVRIAYDTSEPDIIVAFAVYAFTPDDELILHWVNVRKPLWNIKIATNLIADIYPEYKSKPIITTTLCIFQNGHTDKRNVYHPGLTDKYPNLRYNPYVLQKATK